MAKLSMMNDGFRGKMGIYTGFYKNGQMFVRRTAETHNDRNSELQQEVRACFRTVGHIAQQVKPQVALITRPEIAEAQVPPYLYRINQPIFDRIQRRQLRDGSWTRWNPQLFQFANGTLPPLEFEYAKIADSALGDGVKDLQFKIKNYADYKGSITVFIYDDDSKRVQVRQVEAEAEDVVLNQFANMSTWTQIHVYGVWLDGLTSTQTNDISKVAKHVSKTTYIKAAYTPPAPASTPSGADEPPAPQPAAPAETGN